MPGDKYRKAFEILTANRYLPYPEVARRSGASMSTVMRVIKQHPDLKRSAETITIELSHPTAEEVLENTGWDKFGMTPDQVIFGTRPTIKRFDGGEEEELALHNYIGHWPEVAPKPDDAFDLGTVVLTADCARWASESPEQTDFLIDGCRARHRKADWGEIDKEDVPMNEMASRRGGRILSVYEISDEMQASLKIPEQRTNAVWVITQDVRSGGSMKTQTVVLMPHEY